MPNNILITPGSASIAFSGSAANTIRLQVEPSGSVAFYGNSGTLFGITDTLSGSLMSVNDISGLPILEVFSDDRVVMGTFNRNTLVVTGSRVGIDKAVPTADLDISGSVFITGSLNMNSGGITGSVFGTASYASNADLLDGRDSTTFASTGSNTFVGNQIISGSLTTSGSDATINSVTIGRGAGGADTNTVVGITALSSNTIGFSNTAIGRNALQQNLGSSQNTAVGNSAMQNNTTGSNNTAIGSGVMLGNTSGSNNIGIGRNALLVNTTGNSNTVVGTFAMNAVVGGSNNIAIGANAGTSIATGSNNTIIGSIAGQTSLSNTVIIGAGTTERLRIDSSGNVGIGTTAPSASLHVQGNVSASSYTSSINNAVGFLGTASFAISASWAPGVGTSGVSSITAGSGLSGGTITSTGTIALDTSSAHFISGAITALPVGTVSSSTQVVANITGQTIAPSVVSASAVTASNGVVVFGPLQIVSSSGVSTYQPNSAYWYTSGSGIDLWYRHKANSQVKMDWFEGVLETGLIYGGIRGFSGSQAYINAGEGIIVNHAATTSSVTSPTVTYVQWPTLTASIDVTNGFVTYLAISNTGTIVSQSTKFTPTQYHDQLPLGAVGHFNQQAIAAKGDQVNTQHSPIAQLADFSRTFGPIKVSGYGITPQSSSLKFTRASGDAFIYGGFYTVNPETPSNYQSTLVNTGSIAYVYRTGSAQGYAIDANNNNFYTDVKPGFYDVGGTAGTASLASNEWSIQRVFIEPVSGIHYVYYGQSKYTSLANAVANILTDPFSEGPATTLFTVFIGYLIMKGDTTNLADTGSNSILSAGLFRNTSAGSVGGGAAAQLLNDLSDVVISSPVNGQALVYSSGNWINGTATSASFATTASAATSITFTPSTASFATTSSFATTTGNVIGTSQSIALFNSSNAVSSSIIFQSGSNVGVNINNPQARLHVNDSASAQSAQILVTNDGTRTGIRFGSSSLAAGIQSNIFHRTDINLADWIINTSTGLTAQWQFGPTDNSAFAIKLAVPRDGNTTARIFSSTTHSLGIGANNVTDIIWVTGSGNVGIGTTAPGNNRLQVQGNISASTYTSSISNAVGFVGTSSWAQSASISVSSSFAVTSSYVLPSGLPSGVISSSTQEVVSTYTNATDNRVITSTGAGGINAEPGLTFDGSTLIVSGAATNLSSNGQIFNLIGTDHVYTAFYPDGLSAGRKAFIGFGSAVSDIFTIANETGSGHITLAPSSSRSVGVGGNPSTGLGVLQAVGGVYATSYTSSLSSGVGYFGTSSWAQSSSVAVSSSFATTASAATSITFTPNTANTASYVEFTNVANRPTLVSSSLQINTGSFTGSFIGQFIGTSSWAQSSSVALTASAANSITFTPASASFASTASFVNILNQNVSASGNVTAGVNLVSNFSSGDEGGEINLARPQTNTGISGSIVIDVNQNRVRIFESNLPNRGGYWDITTLASGVGTNLAGGAGTVTQVNTGDGLSGGPITGTGTITLNTSSAHFTTGSIAVLNTRGVFSSSGQVNGANITNNTVSYTAGAGLSGGGSATLGGGSVTIDAVAGAGISLTAPTNDAINIDTASAHFTGGIKTRLNVEGVISSSTQFRTITDSFTGSFTGSFAGAHTGTFPFSSLTGTPTLISSSTQFNSLTAPFTGSFTGSFVGTLIGTSSWAQSSSVSVSSSFATTASAANSITFTPATASYALSGSWLRNKAGNIANTAFTGNPRKAAVNFTTAFQNTNYAVVVTGDDSRAWSIEGKVAGGFTASSNSNTALAGTTYWIATAYGET